MFPLFVLRHLLVCVTCAILLGTVFPSAAAAQEAIIRKGDAFLSPGLGIATVWDDFGDKIKVPPLSASLDMGVADNVTLGPYLGFGSTGGEGYGFFVNKQNGDIVGPEYFTYTFKHLLVGVKGAYHFLISGKFTGYAGGILGYHHVRMTYNHTTLQEDGYEVDDEKGSQLLYDVFLAAKYRFTDHTAAFAELGYGITYLNVGVALKLK